MWSRWLRNCKILGLIALVGTGSGCMDITYLVLLQPDGTGFISYQGEASEKGLSRFTETLGLLTMMRVVDEADVARSLGLSSGELTSESLRELYTKERLALLADSLGDGVELLRYQPVRGAGKEGFRALYQFNDINRLRLGPGGNSAVGPDWYYRFSYEPGSSSSSSLRFVPPKKVSGHRDQASASTLDPVIDGLRRMPSADGLVSRLFADGHVRILVQVPGEVVGGSEHLLSGNTVILAEVDANRVPGGSTILNLLSVKEPTDLLRLHQSQTRGVTLIHPTQGMEVRFRKSPLK